MLETKTKLCKCCNEYKEPMDFYPNKRAKDKLNYICKKCSNKKTRAYQIANKEQMAKYSEKYRLKYIKTYADYARNTKYKQNYGITIEDYDRMFALQNNRCALCGSTESFGRSEHFFVDHNHSTGKIRDLLCNHCNTGLGKFRENIELLEKAIQYLKKHSESEIELLINK